MDPMRDPLDAPESTEALTSEVIRCDACPVLCRIRKGQTGACDRYANREGKLVRLDPLLILQSAEKAVPFVDGKPWQGNVLPTFVTGVGATTTGSRKRFCMRAFDASAAPGNQQTRRDAGDSRTSSGQMSGLWGTWLRMLSMRAITRLMPSIAEPVGSTKTELRAGTGPARRVPASLSSPHARDVAGALPGRPHGG